MLASFSTGWSMESINVMQPPSRDRRDRLILQYDKLVERVTRKIIRSMGLPNDLFDELRSAGYLGLVEAAERYQPELGEFPSYAFIRIRGAMIDTLRRSAELSPSAYRVLRALDAVNDLREDKATIERLTQHTTTRPIAEGDQLAHLFEYAAKSALAYRLCAIAAEEEIGEAIPHRDPEGILVARENAALFLSLVESLPPKEREIIELYYFRGKSFIDIAKRSKRYSKSWVSRLHARALELLRQRYNKALWSEDHA